MVKWLIGFPPSTVQGPAIPDPANFVAASRRNLRQPRRRVRPTKGNLRLLSCACGAFLRFSRWLGWLTRLLASALTAPAILSAPARAEFWTRKELQQNSPHCLYSQRARPEENAYMNSLTLICALCLAYVRDYPQLKSIFLHCAAMLAPHFIKLPPNTARA